MRNSAGRVEYGGNKGHAQLRLIRLTSGLMTCGLILTACVSNSSTGIQLASVEQQPVGSPAYAILETPALLPAEELQSAPQPPAEATSYASNIPQKSPRRTANQQLQSPASANIAAIEPNAVATQVPQTTPGQTADGQSIEVAALTSTTQQPADGADGLAQTVPGTPTQPQPVETKRSNSLFDRLLNRSNSNTASASNKPVDQTRFTHDREETYRPQNNNSSGKTLRDLFRRDKSTQNSQLATAALLPPSDSSAIPAPTPVQTVPIVSTSGQVTSASTTPRPSQPLTALPGVKPNSELFGIDNGDANNTTGNTQVASLGGLSRLSPNGLRLQHEKVQVACLKPGVLKLIDVIERHYGKKPIITSGYRSPKRNRRAGGARNSQHVFCKAVDLQVEGVSKWQLAKFVRTIPGRGGVGTYCRTRSVHIDIGKKRDWHHKCRRSSVRKKKKA